MYNLIDIAAWMGGDLAGPFDVARRPLVANMRHDTCTTPCDVDRIGYCTALILDDLREYPTYAGVPVVSILVRASRSTEQLSARFVEARP